MANKGALIIRFVGDARDLNKTTVKVSKNMSGMSKLGLGLAAGVGAVIAGVGALAVSTTKDMMRVETLGKATENVIKATGGAAGRSRPQVDRLAQGLERVTGAEAETVTEGQNMLLTFKNIKGKQFDQATKAALDMGVAMNKGSLKGLDLTATSVRLGKALNDPTKGITALSKAGVTFTDQQKAQIKAMQESGNMAGAQKIILKELQSEFGGAAKAAGQTTEGMMMKIQNTFGNIAEKTLSFVLPMLATLMAWVNNKVMPALTRFGDWLRDDGARHLQAFGSFIKNNVLPPMKFMLDSLINIGTWVVKNRDWLGALAISIGTVVLGIGAYKGAIAAWAAVTKGAVIVQTALTTAFNLFKVAMATHPIGLILLAVTALVAGLVFFFTKTKTGQRIVAWAWKGIKNAIKGVTDWWTKTAWPAIKRGIEILGIAFQAYLRLLKRVWIDGVWGTLKKVWGWVRDKVFLPFRMGLFVLREAFKLARSKIASHFSGVWENLKKVWGWINDRVFKRFRLGLFVLREAFKIGRDKIAGYFTGMRDRLGRVGSWIRENVFGKMRSSLHSMRDAFRNAKDAIGRIWDRLKSAAARPIRFLINTIWNDGLRKMINAIPGVTDIKKTAVKFRQGGPVRGGIAGKDSVRALMMPGEHVWTTAEVAAAGGHQQMLRMRKAVLNGNLNGDPRFAKGGWLDAPRVAKAQTFARQQQFKPYGWGAVGPSAYDCSGFMSAITNILRDRYPHSRVGATADFPWSGFKRGPGQFTIGSTPNYRGSGVGHMVGSLAGLGVESRSGTGVIVGPNAMSTGNPSFTQYHLGASGRAAMNDKTAGWMSTIKRIMGTLKGLPGQIADMMARGGWMTKMLKQLSQRLWYNISGFINRKIPDFGPIKTNPIPRKMARGGLVKARAGGTHIIAGEAGYDEALVPMGGPNAPRSRARTVRVDLDGEFGEWLLKMLRKKIGDNGGDVQIVLGRGKGRG